ncbi:hypothetical protein [Sphingobacterium faecale]|uniref:Collagen-like protein n=1 Tax=Sphingobacterium faecale TaxID=2803775 RepID=A0ABS1R382_9SPHI|nr:hypothetical protein [Sphingobacterium faecale]MBL1409167.1 hypothetical protein [Sphingobacterium faecale]
MKRFSFLQCFGVWMLVFCVYACTKEGDVGPRGLDGLNGAKIHSGTNVPNTDMGVMGDYYLQTNTGQLFGPKSETGWGVPLNLVGTPGTNGTNGTDGLNGATILSGTNAPATSTGAYGDYYFNKSTGDFYGPKSAGGWGSPTSLKGLNGATGAAGSQILSGANAPTIAIGHIGDFYFDTSTSDFYGPKSATSWGIPVNLRGTPGTGGTNGARILHGSDTPPPNIGTAGDYYIHITTGDLYGPKTTIWGSAIMNLRGPQGASGSANVIYSDWITPRSDSLTFFIQAPRLTKDIFDRGQIAVYARVDNHGTYEIIQLSEGWFYTSSEYKMGYVARVGSITIRSSNVRINNTYSFRYVLIPGSISTTARVNMNSFSEVKKVYRIPD